MIESLRTTQTAFFRFATPSGFLRGRRRGAKSIHARVRARENRMKPFGEHLFSVPDPRVFPPPGDRFSAQTTENRIYNWAALKEAAQ